MAVNGSIWLPSLNLLTNYTYSRVKTIFESKYMYLLDMFLSSLKLIVIETSNHNQG